PLVSIVTSSLADGDVASRARIAYERARADFERAEKLKAEKLLTESEFNDAKAAFESARLAYEAVGKSPASGITLTAPIAGYISEALVKEGDFVEVGQPLLSLTRSRHLYLRAEVAEKDFDRVRRVVSARFRTSYSDSVYDLKTRGGRLLSLGRMAGSTSSFIPLTFEFDNCPGVIPGSFADIWLVTAETRNAIAVLNSALTEEQGVCYVYLRNPDDDDCYRKQPVTTGETDGSRTMILSGLHQGDLLVTKGAIHVKLASAGNSIPGHTHNH
ncbi:MAG: efflux RND transporter periplasmic adaptor subunit, partial [Paramuribaculum sp.]|nr:efflux RND transporter periplasmic adaptor subunit [Paramuribaculum sp.]